MKNQYTALAGPNSVSVRVLCSLEERETGKRVAKLLSHWTHTVIMITFEPRSTYQRPRYTSSPTQYTSRNRTVLFLIPNTTPKPPASRVCRGSKAYPHQAIASKASTERWRVLTPHVHNPSHSPTDLSSLLTHHLTILVNSRHLGDFKLHQTLCRPSTSRPFEPS